MNTIKSPHTKTSPHHKNRSTTKYFLIFCILAAGTDYAWGGDIPIKQRRENLRIQNRKAELIEYTRHYETRMGLSPMPIDFLPYLNGGKYCGKAYFTLGVTENGVTSVPSIAYSTSIECQREYTPEKIARHETCHWRMQHGYLNLPEKEMEKEVDTCMDWYKEKNSKKKVLMQVAIFLLMF